MDAPWRLLLIAVLVAALLAGTATAARTTPLIVDHTSTDLSAVPASAIADAKATLHIAYGHTSHGSQLVDGMTGLTSFAGAPLTAVDLRLQRGRHRRRARPGRLLCLRRSREPGLLDVGLSNARRI